MVGQRKAGRIEVQTNGEIYDGKGRFSYDLGDPGWKPIVGSDKRVHGHKKILRVPHIEGVVTENGTLDLVALPTCDDVIVTLTIDGGKTVVLRDAWSTGRQETENTVRFEGREAEEI